MLSRKIPKLKLDLKSKGRSKYNNSPTISNMSFSIRNRKFGKYALQGIPVLSIFALVGILSYGLGIHNLFLESDNVVYAAELASTTGASLIIDDNKVKDTIYATNGEFAYTSHKVTVEASNVESYALTLIRTKDLTGPSTVNGANNQTPTQMNNAWGYAFVDTTTDPTSTNYQTLEATNTLTGPAINSTTHKVSGSKQLIFGAKFGSDAASGTYHAEATLSMVATPITIVNYSITYNTVGGSTVIATTASDDTGAGSKVLTISNTVPTRDGYAFGGWTTISNGNIEYQPGDGIRLQATQPDITLYAVWKLPSFPSTLTTMQGMTADICKSVNVGVSKTLTDSRDNSTYTIRKMNDSQCWMTQNLRIVNRSISYANSDMTSGSFTVPASSTSGFSSDGVANAYYSNNTTNGAYYSWCAATAGSCTSATSVGVNAPSSICPKGWKLPISGSGISGTNTGATSDAKNDFMMLFGKTTTSNFTDTSLVSGTNIVLSGTVWPLAGVYSSGSQAYADTRGLFWSRTAASDTQAYALLVDNNGRIYPSYTDGRRYGNTVRCVAYAY